MRSQQPTEREYPPANTDNLHACREDKEHMRSSTAVSHAGDLVSQGIYLADGSGGPCDPPVAEGSKTVGHERAILRKAKQDVDKTYMNNEIRGGARGHSTRQPIS